MTLVIYIFHQGRPIMINIDKIINIVEFHLLVTIVSMTQELNSAYKIL